MDEIRCQEEAVATGGGLEIRAVSLTLGLGRANAQGRAVVLDALAPVPALKSLLEAPGNNGLESWLIPSRFRDNYRSNQNWIAAAGAVVDLDYKGADGKKALLPVDILRAAGKAFRSPNIAYPTPHGLRAVYLFQREVADVDLFKRATRGAMEIVAQELRAAGVKVFFDHEPPLAEALKVDPCSLTAAQFFFAPRALVDGHPRNGSVKLFNQTPWSPEALARLAPLETPVPPFDASSAPPVPKGPAAGPTPDFTAAVAKYVADHPRDWPVSSGTCPACGHGGCFGRMPDDQTRWACFSSDHEVDSRGVGVPGDGVWHGDILDLDAHAADVSPAELLAQTGYLAGRSSSSDVDGLPTLDFDGLAVPSDGGDGSSTPRLKFLTVDELKNMPEATLNWVVRGVVAKGAVTLIGGPKAVGKSTLVAALLSAIETGQPFAGFETVPGTAVYLSEEPASAVMEKCRRFGVRHAAFLVREHFDASLKFGDFMAEAAAAAKRLGATVLLVDTWTRFARLAKDGEKDAGATQFAMESALAAAAQGLAVIIITHFRKDAGAEESDGAGEAIRGSTALTAAVEIVVELRRHGNDRRSPFRMLSFVSRYADTPKEDMLLELVGSAFVLRGEGEAGRLHTVRDRIIEVLGAAADLLTKKELLGRVKGKTENFNKALDGLVTEGLVARTAGGKRGDPFRFALAGPSIPFPVPIPIPEGREQAEEHSYPLPPPYREEGEGDARKEGTSSSGLPHPGEGNVHPSSSPTGVASVTPRNDATTPLGDREGHRKSGPSAKSPPATASGSMDPRKE